MQKHQVRKKLFMFNHLNNFIWIARIIISIFRLIPRDIFGQINTQDILLSSNKIWTCLSQAILLTIQDLLPMMTLVDWGKNMLKSNTFSKILKTTIVFQKFPITPTNKRLRVKEESKMIKRKKKLWVEWSVCKIWCCPW